MIKKLWLLIALGLILRVLLSFFTYHSDTTALQLGGFLVGSGHILSLYDYLFNLPPNDPILQKFSPLIFTYPPLIYLFNGLFNFIYGLIGLGFINNYLLVSSNTFGDFGLNWAMLLVKLPYLIFDLLMALALAQLVESPRQKYLAVVAWIFNPINLFATYMVGDHDLIATYFIVLAILLAKRRRLSFSALALGFGVAFKIFPIFLIVPLCLLEKSWLNRSKLIGLTVLPYLISIIPYLNSPGYKTTALLANQSLKSLYAAIPVSGGESLLLFPLVLVAFYLWIYYHSVGFNWQRFWQSSFIILLIFFIFTHTHPQWFLWLSPFIILFLIESKYKYLLPVVISVVSWFGLLFFFDPGLTLGLFRPLLPFVNADVSIWQLIHRSMDYNLDRSILQTLFSASAIYLIYYYFPRNSHQ